MAKIHRWDTVIYSLVDGKFQRTGDPIFSENLLNFVITCDYGDWSGFRSLAECEAQFAELEAKGKPNFFFQVVERF